MKTVIEMAKEAGLFTHKEVPPEIRAFAELVRADAIATEREACAKVCDEYDGSWYAYRKGAQECAAAIRARSNT